MGGAAGAFRARRAGAGGDQLRGGLEDARGRARAASPQPGGCSPRKFKSKAGVSRHRGDSAPGCFAPEPRNGRALEPEAITKQPERPVAGASPSRGPGNEGEGGGRGAAGEPAPAWEIPKPRGLAPPRASGLPAGVAGSFSASEALSPFFHPPRGLDSRGQLGSEFRTRNPPGARGTEGKWKCGRWSPRKGPGAGAALRTVRSELGAAGCRGEAPARREELQSPQVPQNQRRLAGAPKRATLGKCPKAKVWGLGEQLCGQRQLQTGPVRGSLPPHP